MNKNLWSPFVRCFDASNPNWKDTRGENFAFIQSREDSAKQLIEKNGRVFLNQVYRSLGFDYIENGWTFGWLKSDFFSFEVCFENEDRDIWIDFVEF